VGEEISLWPGSPSLRGKAVERATQKGFCRPLGTLCVFPYLCWHVIFGGWTLPMRVSWAALVIAGFLAYGGLRFSRHRQRTLDPADSSRTTILLILFTLTCALTPGFQWRLGESWTAKGHIELGGIARRRADSPKWVFCPSNKLGMPSCDIS